VLGSGETTPDDDAVFTVVLGPSLDAECFSCSLLVDRPAGTSKANPPKRRSKQSIATKPKALPRFRPALGSMNSISADSAYEYTGQCVLDLRKRTLDYSDPFSRDPVKEAPMRGLTKIANAIFCRSRCYPKAGAFG
jgi:hypothetical protein